MKRYFVNIFICVTIGIGVLENCCKPCSGALSERLSVFFSSNQNNKPVELQHDAYIEKYGLETIKKLCPKTACFNSYNPKHREAVVTLTESFSKQCKNELNQLNEFYSKNLDDDVHPRIWYSAIIRAQCYPKYESLLLPSPIELFPTDFFPKYILRPYTSEQACMFFDDRFGKDNGIENRLWYFREDPQINLHHGIWHLLYPVNSTEPATRRGELFYYFHHDLLARYTAERLSNNLEATSPLDLQWGSDLAEGYHSNLVDGVSNSKWAEREPWTSVSNKSLNCEMVDYFFQFTDKRQRVDHSTTHGIVKGNNSQYLIKRYDYINLLGDLSEASKQSFNPYYYGESGFHDDGHWIIANIDVNLYGNNPKDPTGIIADTLTALRDPLFYRWHQYVDNLFQKYKTTHLDAYQLHEGDFPLVFNGVRVYNVRVVAEGPQNTPGRLNHLETFWSIQKFDLRGRLDFRGSNTDDDETDFADVCVKHLNHQEFFYEISIENGLKVSTPATIRIFMAPRFKSQELYTRYKLSEQRSLFFAMDLFTANLKPGKNILKRLSIDSTLTTPWPLPFKEIKELVKNKKEDKRDRSQRAAYDCGYPHHLLLPKGNEKGMVFDLFVMVTNGVHDKVQDDSKNYFKKYRPTPIHCGSPGREYPDNKPMGYPFDRKPFTTSKLVNLPSGRQIIENREVETLEEYAKEIPNMMTSQIIIQHRDEIAGMENFVKVYYNEETKNRY